MSRKAINVHVPADLHAQLKASNFNLSEIACAAWRTALAENQQLESEYGPVTPIKLGTHKRPYVRRPAREP